MWQGLWAEASSFFVPFIPFSSPITPSCVLPQSPLPAPAASQFPSPPATGTCKERGTAERVSYCRTVDWTCYVPHQFLWYLPDLGNSGKTLACDARSTWVQIPALPLTV